MAKAGDDKGSNRPALALHVPEPHYRPGDTVDFSHIRVPEAGSAPRPDEACEARETYPLCDDLIRVLGDDNKAHGPWDPRLDADTLRRMLREMALVRAFDGRMYRAQRQGMIPTYEDRHTLRQRCLGGICKALGPGDGAVIAAGGHRRPQDDRADGEPDAHQRDEGTGMAVADLSFGLGLGHHTLPRAKPLAM